MRQQFTVATFNLLNLIGPNQPYYDREGLSQREYDEKCDWIANLFDTLDADIIGVQEVWRESALYDVCARSKTMRDARLIRAPGATVDNQLPKVGIVSRFPAIGEVESIETLPEHLHLNLPHSEDPMFADIEMKHQVFSRPVLRVALNLASPHDPPKPLWVHVVHLKSKRPQRAEREETGEDLDNPRLNATASLRSLIMRGAEATALRHLVLEKLAGCDDPVMIIGDFNDNADAVTTEIIAGRASPFDKEARDHLLFNCSNLEFRHKLRRDVGYTHVHQGDPDTIDHILVSEQFNPISRRCIYRLTRLDYYNDHLNIRSETTSDHGALRAMFHRNESSS